MLNTNMVWGKLNMKTVTIDSGIINSNHHAGPYNVNYMVYYDPKPRGTNSIYISEDPIKEYTTQFAGNRACFAGVSDLISSYGGYKNTNPYNRVSAKQNMPMPNRIYYKMSPGAGSPKLTATEKYAWLRLCKEHKLLPHYVVPSTVMKKRVVFDISETPPSLLYAYLTMMRAVVEYPGFVKGVVYLCTKLDLNFYAAFVYATKIYITNMGHHIISPYREYRSNTDRISGMKGIEAHLMINLKRFVDNISEIDSRHMSAISRGGWQCSNNIDRASNIRCSLRLPDIFKPSLEKAIMAETVVESQQYLDEIKSDPEVKVVFKDFTLTKPKETVKKKTVTNKTVRKK